MLVKLDDLDPTVGKRTLIWPACDRNADRFGAKFFTLFRVHTGVLFFGAGHLDLQ